MDLQRHDAELELVVVDLDQKVDVEAERLSRLRLCEELQGGGGDLKPEARPCQTGEKQQTQQTTQKTHFW